VVTKWKEQGGKKGDRAVWYGGRERGINSDKGASPGKRKKRQLWKGGFPAAKKGALSHCLKVHLEEKKR